MTTNAIKIPEHPNYRKNRERGGEGYPCVVCGKTITTPRYHVRVHYGGSYIISQEHAEELNAAGREAEDLYYYPIGVDCLRKHPEIKPFATKVEDRG